MADRDDRVSRLDPRIQQTLSENPDRTQAAADDLSNPLFQRKWTAEEVGAYQDHVKKFPKPQVVELDRSIPIGTGEGERNTYDWKDERARRMFALDQGTGSKDAAASPTMDSTDALYRSTEYLNHAIMQTQLLDPELAYELQLADRFLVMYPEFAIATRGAFGFAGATEQAMHELMGMDIESFAEKAKQDWVFVSDVSDQFYSEVGPTLDPSTKDIINVSLAGISEKEQKRMLALSAAYVDARPLNSDEDQLEFSNWFAQEALGIYNTESDQSLWGKIGRVGAHVFTNPADYIQDEVIGSLWTAATDPADAWYRKELQLEETMALSMGHDVGTSGWATYTGLMGAGIDIVIDPTNVAFGALSAVKAIKTAAYVDDIVTAGSRFRNVARQFIPVGSRSAARKVGLPVGVRGRSARIAWTAFAKTHDGLMTAARKNGVFEHIARTTSYATVIEEIPELKNVDPGLVKIIMASDDPLEVERLYEAGLRGSLLDPSSVAHHEILSEEIDSAADVKRILTDLTPDQFNAGDIATSNGGGVYHNLPILIDDVPDVKVVARGGKDSIDNLGQLDIDDLDDMAKNTTDPAIRTRLDEYRTGTHDAPLGDEVDDAIIDFANTRRGGDINTTDPEAFGQMQTAATRAIDGGLETKTVPFDLGDGVMGTAEFGQNKTYGRYTVIRDEAGTIVGGRVDNLGGVDPAAQGKGVYGRILELQRDKLGLSGEAYAAETGKLTDEAARVGARVFDTDAVTVAKNTGVAVDPIGHKGVVSFVRKGDTIVVSADPGSKKHAEIVSWLQKNRNFRGGGVRPDGTITTQAMRSYMKANNVDVLTINGNAVFADLGKLRRNGGIQTFQGGRSQNSGLQAANQRKLTAAYNRRMVTPKGDTVSKWVISDMPTKVRTPKQDFRFWNKQFGVFSGKKFTEANWAQRKLRGLVASVFLDDVPPSIRTGWNNRADGVVDLRKLLTQMGVDPALVRRSLDDYLEDPSQATVLRIITDAGEDMGDPEIALGLYHFNQKNTNTLEYAVINKGEQLTSGRRADGSEGLQPLIPSQTRDFVQLPDQRAFSAHIRRTKRATTRTFKSRNRGWGETRKQRQKLVDQFGATLGTKSEAGMRWAAMTKDEQFATAYAVVRPSGSTLGDGLGYAAKFGQTFSSEWGRLRNAFSVAMLAWRPIGWAGNEMLDNAFRAGLADGLGLFTHPFRSLASIWDSRNINRAVKQRKNYQAATAPVRALLRGSDEPAEMLAKVAEIIPDVGKYVETAEDSASQAIAIKKFLNTELITEGGSIKVLDDSLAKALHRQRKGYSAAQKYSLPTGKGDDLFDPDWDDVSLTGMEQYFTHEVGSSSSRIEWTQGVRRVPEQLEEYTTAVGNVWTRDLKDPAIRMWLNQFAELGSGGEDASRAARQFVNTGGWNTMEEPIRNMARFDGMDVDTMNELQLAEWYFKNKVGPYVEDTFGDILTPENVGLMLNGEFVATVDGVQHIVDLDDLGTIQDFIQGANGTNFKLPQSVVGVVNPRSVYGFGKESKGWKTPLRSYNQWALEKFGHDIPAKLQRRPAYINTFKRYKDNYMRLGLTEEGANVVAKQKAMEHINKTFFFVEAQTPFLKSMNQIFPFFAAQYEIVKAWTWNIPALNGGFGIGHARVLRTFDHVFTSFRDNGLLQPRYNRDGEVDGWDLQFASDPHTDNLAGQLVSKAGYLAIMSPAIVVEQLAEIFTESDLDLTPDEVNFRFNHPYEFFGKGGGVLPTARMQFGLNPAMAMPVSKLIDQLPFTSTSNPVQSEDGQNLEVYIADNEVTDRTAFLTANRHKLLDSGAVTEEQFMQLSDGTLGFSTINLPEGLDLMIPGTTLAGSFISTVLQPYGSTDSFQEVVSDFTPRVITNMAKSMGLFLNDGEEGAATWLPNVLMGPTGRSGMGVARADAIITLEMEHGLLTRSGEIAELMAAEEEGSPKMLELKGELEAIDDLIAKETKEISASRAFVQTVFGVFMPFNPKMPDKAATLREYYFQARTTADQWKDGNPVPMPFDNRNAREAWSMVAAWAADETGSIAKQEFLTQHGGRSSILAAISPRNFWGGTGIPVWQNDMTQYFDRVEKGDIVPLSPDVLRYKIRSMQIQVEREMVFIEEYGNDPVTQAWEMLADGANAREISELYDEKWRALEMEDEIVNDGAWAEYSLDIGDNYVDFAYNEQLEIIEGIDIAIEEIDINMFPTDPQEARRMRGKLIGLRDSAYAAVDVYNDGRYADWEVSPRQAVLNEYWAKWGDYNDELQNQYRLVENANTGEEVSAAYDQIARWRTENSDQAIMIGGVKFPSPAARSWNNMDDEHKAAMADAKLSDKLEWLSHSDVEHIVEVYPAAELYMPTSENAKTIFDWKSSQDALLAAKYRIGGEFIEQNKGSSKPRTDHQKAIDEEFERRLRDSGEFGVLENINNYPVENFEQFGSLPTSMNWIVPYAVAVHRQLDAWDKSPLSNAGKQQQRWVYGKTLEQFERNPGLRDDMLAWGMRVFEESTVEGIVAQLLGNYKGDLE